MESCASCGEILVRGERRLLTVLFADLTGYTGLAARLDPEDVYAFVRPVMNDLVRVVESFGGTVPQVMGDGFMAVFGYPIAQEDHAERAVRAALAAVRHVRDRNAAGRGPTLPEVHAGVNTGEVVVADSWEPAGFSLVGDVVNVASRLSGLAGGGHVLAGERTYALSRHAIRYGRAASRSVRGKPERIRVHEPIEPISVLPEGHVAPPGSTGFVGRAQILVRLERELEAAAVDGTSRVVVIRGEAGLGKTRLAAEFAARVSDATVLAGRCPPYGPARPLSALTDAFLGLAGTSVDASTRSQEAAVQDLARRLAPTRAGWIAGRLRLLLGFEQPPPDEPVDLLAAARSVLDALAGGTRPAVLILDDLHWSDPDLRSLLRDIATNGWSVPLLVLALARPEFDLRAPNARSVSLDGLYPGELLEMLRSSVGTDLPPALEARLILRAGGNPLFLEEAIRMMLEARVLLRDDGGWSLREPDVIERVPLTLRSLITARLDTLGPDERSTLQEASILGATIDPSHLAAFGGGTATAGTIRSLVSRDFLLRSDPALGTYEFRHVLIREVAYESMPRRVRATRHLRLGLWLREHSGERAPAVDALAYHFERAWSLARTETGPGPPAHAARMASRYLRLAGERVLPVEPRAARSLFERGLEIAGSTPGAIEPGDVAGLMAGAAEALLDLGRHDEAVSFAERAMEEAHGVGDRGVEARILLTLGRSRSDRGEVDQARPVIERALRTYRRLGDLRGQARALERLSETWQFHDFPKQLALARRAHATLPDDASPAERARSAQELAYLLTLAGGTEFERRHEEARRVADESGDLRSQAGSLRTWGWYQFNLGLPDRAAAAARLARPLAIETGDRWIEVDTMVLECQALAASGPPEEAEELVERLLEIAGQARARRLRSIALLIGARPALRLGRLDVARGRLAAARRSLAALRDDVFVVDADRADLEVALDRGAWSRVPTVSARVAAGSASNGWRLYRPLGPLFLGRSLLGRARPEAAVATLRRAHRAAETVGTTGLAALARESLVQARLLAGDVGRGTFGSDQGDEDPAVGISVPETAAIRAENDGLRQLREDGTSPAAEAFERAVELWGRMGSTIWLARGLGLWGSTLRSAGRRRDADRAAGRAAEVMERLGVPRASRAGLLEPPLKPIRPRARGTGIRFASPRR